jgi:release factor glutamine methyltransferase
MTTIRATLETAVPRLEAAGVDSPRLDAELLLAHVMGAARGWLWAHPEAPVPPSAEAHFHALLARRLRREPLPYLLGTWEFYAREFDVTPAVLIPRPETELLVEAVLAWARPRGARRLADIGTGSGAIAVTVAAELPDAEVIAVDLSDDALAVARGNAARHGVGARIDFRRGNLLAPITEPRDAIVANLPYISDEELRALMPEVRDHEPRLALAGGPDGLDLVRRLITDAPRVLVPGGLLALELGHTQAPAVQALLAPWGKAWVVMDYAGIARHVLAERSER